MRGRTLHCSCGQRGLCSETESGAFRKITAPDRRREGTNVQRYKRG